MVALYTVWYNFVKVHMTLRMNPAMAAGVSDRLWSMEDVAELVEASLPKPGKRGPTKSAQRKIQTEVPYPVQESTFDVIELRQ
jgi:hypothetical protein